ncbi:retron St85 family RNA-directed DNA polymerase [Emticicia sp. TH156]|uniref:retron St85 family RNA-directed DNA polymerase n=1 Tax=Emticicia sp. TH156 TaxID=2067454 RepID=UPI000C75C86B|nr:retron St85 family RNA-directed DNA polymerase [Emticicia sp. TH156]PLK44359.1 RNA-directed DNA polymerase [Emticicia sp. TH156]
MSYDSEENIEQKLKIIRKYSKQKNHYESLLKDISIMEQKGSILIINNKHLADLVGISFDGILKIINSSQSFYYSFSIPKKNGGYRVISMPFPSLMKVQRWIYENVLLKHQIHKVAKGFVKELSIKDNASEHLGSKELLKMDIQDFFPSISKKRIISIFKRLGYNNKVSYSLASICCLNQCLPQGAPTSPTLSNIIAYKLDNRIQGLANKFNIIYTRYADDLTFSGDTFPPFFYSTIQRILLEEGFNVNKDKTRLIKEGRQKIVTGISISSDKMTIPKIKKREIRHAVYFILKRGLFAHQQAIGNYDPIYIDRIIGYLHFWQFVEPENEFVRKSIIEIKTNLASLEEEFKVYIDSNLKY